MARAVPSRIARTAPTTTAMMPSVQMIGMRAMKPMSSSTSTLLLAVGVAPILGHKDEGVLRRLRRLARRALALPAEIADLDELIKPLAAKETPLLVAARSNGDSKKAYPNAKSCATPPSRSAHISRQKQPLDDPRGIEIG